MAAPASTPATIASVNPGQSIRTRSHAPHRKTNLKVQNAIKKAMEGIIYIGVAASTIGSGVFLLLDQVQLSLACLATAIALFAYGILSGNLSRKTEEVLKLEQYDLKGEIEVLKPYHTLGSLGVIDFPEKESDKAFIKTQLKSLCQGMNPEDKSIQKLIFIKTKSSIQAAYFNVKENKICFYSTVKKEIDEALANHLPLFFDAFKEFIQETQAAASTGLTSTPPLCLYYHKGEKNHSFSLQIASILNHVKKERSLSSLEEFNLKEYVQSLQKLDRALSIETLSFEIGQTEDEIASQLHLKAIESSKSTLVLMNTGKAIQGAYYHPLQKAIYYFSTEPSDTSLASSLFFRGFKKRIQDSLRPSGSIDVSDFFKPIAPLPTSFGEQVVAIIQASGMERVKISEFQAFNLKAYLRAASKLGEDSGIAYVETTQPLALSTIQASIRTLIVSSRQVTDTLVFTKDPSSIKAAYMNAETGMLYLFSTNPQDLKIAGLDDRPLFYKAFEAVVKEVVTTPLTLSPVTCNDPSSPLEEQIAAIIQEATKEKKKDAEVSAFPLEAYIHQLLSFKLATDIASLSLPFSEGTGIKDQLIERLRGSEEKTVKPTLLFFKEGSAIQAAYFEQTDRRGTFHFFSSDTPSEKSSFFTAFSDAVLSLLPEADPSGVSRIYHVLETPTHPLPLKLLDIINSAQKYSTRKEDNASSPSTLDIIKHFDIEKFIDSFRIYLMWNFMRALDIRPYADKEALIEKMKEHFTKPFFGLDRVLFVKDAYSMKVAMFIDRKIQFFTTSEVECELAIKRKPSLFFEAFEAYVLDLLKEKGITGVLPQISFTHCPLKDNPYEFLLTQIMHAEHMSAAALEKKSLQEVVMSDKDCQTDQEESSTSSSGAGAGAT